MQNFQSLPFPQNNPSNFYPPFTAPHPNIRNQSYPQQFPAYTPKFPHLQTENPIPIPKNESPKKPESVGL